MKDLENTGSLFRILKNDQGTKMADRNPDDYKKVLIISYAFPPVNLVGSMRPFYLCKYLPDSGWTPFVISRKVWSGASVDKEMCLPANNPTKVYRCRDIWDIPLLRSRIIGWLLRPAFIPDEFIFWNISVFFQTLKLIFFKHGLSLISNPIRCKDR